MSPTWASSSTADGRTPPVGTKVSIAVTIGVLLINVQYAHAEKSSPDQISRPELVQLPKRARRRGLGGSNERCESLGVMAPFTCELSELGSMTRSHLTKPFAPRARYLVPYPPNGVGVIKETGS